MSDFDKIFIQYHSRLFVYANKFVRDEDVALDLIQDVFATVLESKKFLLDPEHLKAYLFASVRNSCLNHIKHQKIVQKHQQSQMADFHEMELKYYEDGEQSIIEKENLEKIYQAINSLSKAHKEVIELSRFEGLKNYEIAEKLNIPVRTVETRLYRALSSLKDKLSLRLFHILLCASQLREYVN